MRYGTPRCSEDIGTRLGVGAAVPAVDTLALGHSEKAFGCRVVGTTPDSAHAANDIVAREKSLVFVTGELAAAVRM